MAPIAPFFADQLFLDLNKVTGKDNAESVHLAYFPEYDASVIDKNLEACMDLAQQTSSMILALRKKAEKKVRQPLSKAVIPAWDDVSFGQISYIADLIKTEVNIKELEVIPSGTDMDNVVKKLKPNFKVLGKKYGKLMKELANVLSAFDNKQIKALEIDGKYVLNIGDEVIEIIPEDVEIITEDMPGWMVSNEGKLTVALDITVTDDLLQEGIARELVNRIQNIRKSSGLEITDRIRIEILESEAINHAVLSHKDYITSQTLADSLVLVKEISDGSDLDFEEYNVVVKVSKV
jgi:isoleucyl-tRNA synthetase